MTIADSYFWEGTTIGQAGPYSSAQFAEFVDQAIATGYDGVVHFAENELSVLASSPASKVVNVSTGSAIVRGRVGVNSAITPFTIADNTSGQPRIDAVVVRVTYATQTVALAVLQGSPAASPAVPALTQTASVWEVYLASIAVANGFTTIAQGDISDLRGYTNGLYQYITVIPATGFVGFGKTPSYRVDIAGSLGVYDAGSRIIIAPNTATIVNNTFLQSSEVNGASVIRIMPNGTSVTSAIAAFNNSTPTNAAFIGFQINSTVAQINSSITGSGSYLPITFNTNAAERMRLDTSGNLVVGATTALARLHSTAADGTYQLGLSGTTKGIRISTTSGSSFIEGVDNTLTGSNQPLAVGGSRLNFRIAGTNIGAFDENGNFGAGTISPSTRLHASLDDATTNAVTNVVTIAKNTTGTPAAGLGAGLQLMAETSTTVDTLAGRVTASWATVTHLSRVGELKLYASDSGAERLGITISGNGSAPLMGVFGVAAVARPNIIGSRGGNAALADLLTKGAAVGYWTDGTSA